MFAPLSDVSIIMNLLYFSEANLRDYMFLRNFVHNYALAGQSIIVHPYIGTESDTRAITKRISWLLSDALVHNVAFGADQRNILTQTEQGQLQLDAQRVAQLIAPVKVLVLAGLAKHPDGSTQAADAYQLLKLIKQQLPIACAYFFPENPKSALVQQIQQVATPNDATRLQSLFEEESATIQLAAQLAPSVIASPSSYVAG